MSQNLLRTRGVMAVCWTGLFAACSHHSAPPSNPGPACACAASSRATDAEALHVAAEKHDLAQLKCLLESGTWDVNKRNAAGLTPLQAAFVSLGRVLGHSIFSTPCAADPAACEPSALASAAPWPSGMCKQAYAFVRARMQR